MKKIKTKKDQLKPNHKFNLSKIRFITESKEHSSLVSSLCLTKDNRLASCSYDTTIKIFNLSTFQNEISIEGHTKSVNYISLLLNGNLISSSSDKTIKIWEIKKLKYKCIQTLKEHNDSVRKAIQLSSNKIGSCSRDKTIKIWGGFSSYSCLKTLKEHKAYVKEIIEIENSTDIISGDFDGTIIFWKDFQVEKIIKCIGSFNFLNIIQVGNNIFVTMNSAISVINLITKEVETHIQLDKRIITIYSIINVTNGSFLCGDRDGNLINIDYKEYKTIFFQPRVHKNCINALLIVRDKLISCSNSSIKVWEF